MQPYGLYITDPTRSRLNRTDSKYKRLLRADKMFFVGVKS